MRTVSLRVPAPLLVTALTALTVAACTSSSRAVPAACTPADLRVTAAYIQGATQHAIYNLRFTNVSPTACKLTGYPAVSLVTAGNSSGHPIGSPRPLIMHNPESVTTATLAPGQHALALLGVAEIVLFTGASCNPVLAHWLRVYPPHLRHAVYLPIKAHTCSSSSDQVLEIGPIYPDSRTTACLRNQAERSARANGSGQVEQCAPAEPLVTLLSSAACDGPGAPRSTLRMTLRLDAAVVECVPGR